MNTKWTDLYSDHFLGLLSHPAATRKDNKKDNKSIPGEASMAYFLKPLTYNSNVAGYLIKAFPGKWTTIDATTKKALSTFDDSQILVPGTNTPDLREAVRQVQKSVDERAIQARQR